MHSFGTDTAAPETRSRNIELELRDFTQLFNPIDSSPFENKDLNPDVEEFIVGSAEEYPPNEALTLRIYLGEWPTEDPTELLCHAVHNYFSYRARLNRLGFRRLMKRGRISLLIGLMFLAVCLLSSRLLLGEHEGTWATIIRESLSIAGWVGMWRPIEIYFYDWWPLRRRGRIYEKLSRMPVKVSQKNKE
ncbi:MAG TPA: hypothetical protein VJ719_09085 [Chthoniobacterales bacterium]|nr:hypothetical protein [Chthoniobacterales bacterium]